MLRDRRPADLEMGRDVARRTLRVPDETEDLPSPRLGDRLQGSLHGRDVSRCLRWRQRTARRKRPERVRLEHPVLDERSVARWRSREAGCFVRSASASALAEPEPAEDVHHGATDLASAPFERVLAPAGRPARPAGGPEPTIGRERACLAPRRRPAEDATEVHQRLVPVARRRGVEPRSCASRSEPTRRPPRPARLRGSRERRSSGRSCPPRPRARRSRSMPRRRRCTDRRREAGEVRPEVSRHPASE